MDCSKLEIFYLCFFYLQMFCMIILLFSAEPCATGHLGMYRFWDSSENIANSSFQCALSKGKQIFEGDS